MMRGTSAAIAGGAGLVLALSLAGCNRSEPGTPAPGTGAAGMVSEDGAGAAQNPTPDYKENGGMAGQTPAYGQPGAGPSERLESRTGGQGTSGPVVGGAPQAPPGPGG